MFRLSQIRNLRLQAIISKEMMNAFEDAFKISSGDTEQIASNIEMFCEEMSIPMNSPLERDLLIYKITGMIQEVADSSTAYTFDEQGDWILSKFLLYFFCSLPSIFHIITKHVGFIMHMKAMHMFVLSGKSYRQRFFS